MSEKSKTIAMSPVKSGQIAEIGHDGDTLAVRFKHGSLDKCVIYADIDAEKSGCKLVAVMNDNGADDAKWRDHRCTFEPCQKVGADKTAPEGNNAELRGRPLAGGPA